MEVALCATVLAGETLRRRVHDRQDHRRRQTDVKADETMRAITRGWPQRVAAASVGETAGGEARDPRS